jgi:hypothetical protein
MGVTAGGKSWAAAKIALIFPSNCRWRHPLAVSGPVIQRLAATEIS